MRNWKLALLGFGNVGQAFARLLLEKRSELQNRYGVDYLVTGIASARHGKAIDPRGINLFEALKLAEEKISLNGISKIPLLENSLDFIRCCNATILFENTPVNYSTGQPAVDHLRMSLEMNMHIITANKGPIVYAYRELTNLAKIKEKKFFFESTVMDGAPIFSLFRSALPAAHVQSFRGILNSTTNMILTKMEEGVNFEQAVAYAQKIGIAETDPSGDVDGWDAAIKVAALVTVLMERPLLPHEVERIGIREITSDDISRAKKLGKRWKLVCSAELENGKLNAQVIPKTVSPDSPLYNVSGTSSVVQFETDVLGLLTIIEQDPGPSTTAYGLFADFLNTVRN
jgi:homoserine dehydrogenase